MISNEASAKELASSNAITLAALHNTSPYETRTPKAVCAPALAKEPSRFDGASAQRSDRLRDTDHKSLSPSRRAGSGFKPVFVHLCIIYAMACKRKRSGFALARSPLRQRRGPIMLEVRAFARVPGTTGINAMSAFSLEAQFLELA